MKTFETYLSQIENQQQQLRMKVILKWVCDQFPDLDTRVAWNQPMFTHHGTFIIGFSIAKPHIAVSPELAGMKHFYKDIAESGYSQSTMLFRIKWNQDVDYSLLDKIIKFNCMDKAECKTFWRK